MWSQTSPTLAVRQALARGGNSTGLHLVHLDSGCERTMFKVLGRVLELIEDTTCDSSAPARPSPRTARHTEDMQEYVTLEAGQDAR